MTDKKPHIGTLRCKLFGHKFIFKSPKNLQGEIAPQGTAFNIPTSFCVKCGITREELNK